jgi:hypothetical protein
MLAASPTSHYPHANRPSGDDFESLRPESPPADVEDMARRRDDFIRSGAFDRLIMQRGLEALELEAQRDVESRKSHPERHPISPPPRYFDDASSNTSSTRTSVVSGASNVSWASRRSGSRSVSSSGTSVVSGTSTVAWEDGGVYAGGSVSSAQWDATSVVSEISTASWRPGSNFVGAVSPTPSNATSVVSGVSTVHWVHQQSPNPSQSCLNHAPTIPRREFSQNRPHSRTTSLSRNDAWDPLKEEVSKYLKLYETADIVNLAGPFGNVHLTYLSRTNSSIIARLWDRANAHRDPQETLITWPGDGTILDSEKTAMLVIGNSWSPTTAPYKRNVGWFLKSLYFLYRANLPPLIFPSKRLSQLSVLFAQLLLSQRGVRRKHLI